MLSNARWERTSPDGRRIRKLREARNEESLLMCWSQLFVRSRVHSYYLQRFSGALSNYWIRLSYDMKNSADLGVRLERSKMFRRQFPHFVLTTKTTQPRPQVFSINGSIACNRLHFWRHFDVIGSIWQNSFQIWSTAAGHGELCVWF